eukprot:5055691-Pleurochrysis_carterae.AAC.1
MARIDVSYCTQPARPPHRNAGLQRRDGWQVAAPGLDRLAQPGTHISQLGSHLGSQMAKEIWVLIERFACPDLGLFLWRPLEIVFTTCYSG